MGRKKAVAKGGAVGNAGAGERRVLSTVRAGSGGPDLAEVQVDPQAAEAFISEKRIGERIKYLRLKKSMGLVEMGRHTGLVGELFVAAGDRTCGAYAAQSGADCDGVLEGPELLL